MPRFGCLFRLRASSFIATQDLLKAGLTGFAKIYFGPAWVSTGNPRRHELVPSRILDAGQAQDGENRDSG